MKNYQFIAISVSESRRLLLERQFKELEIEGLTFLENPSTPENSKDYLPDGVSEITKRIICGTKSYIRAMLLACQDDSPEFTIVLEDDASFHKTHFINGVEEIIENWEDWIFPSRMVSIGWIPMENYSFYIGCESDFTMKSGSKVFNNGTTAVGFQAVIIRKKDISPIIHHFTHPTFNELKQHLHSQNFPGLNKDNDIVAADHFINKILGQARIFPPLAIEQNQESTIGHNNQELYWSKFFKGYEFIKNNYWSY